ncbi:MAG: hypothetical protein J6I55_05925 [Ruminococcus sp.]|nr:hypothetical protein [Ruminococcus sp.]
MSESRFIRTVTFGGYDKNDVNRKLDSLYKQIYNLKNELEEIKLINENYKKNTDTEKNYESVLSDERTRLSNLQAENEENIRKIKELENETEQKNIKISELEEKNKSLEKLLNDFRTEIEGLRAGDDAAALSTVFIEAQKSADLIKVSAKEKADEIEENTRKLSENTIKDADNTAAEIIYEAEKKAAEIQAAALAKAEQVRNYSDSVRAKMSGDTSEIHRQLEELKEIFETFTQKGSSLISNSENFLHKTRTELESDSFPSVPENINTVPPQTPEITPVNHSYPQTEQDKELNESLKKLQEMAESFSIGKKTESPAPDADTTTQKESDNKPETDNKPENKSETDNKPEPEKKKSSGIDLDALMKQAAALNE